MSVAFLVNRQNPDGGWPYARGVSWTEPTVYAVLALHAAGATEPAEKGIGFLRSLRRRDGGWSPQADIEESTWVTALAALLPSELLDESAHTHAVRWLADVTGEESTATYRVRQWLLGQSPLSGKEPPGWPWMTGAAAWVAPTSLAILALERHCRRQPDAGLQRRIAEGREFLLTRKCQEGGWNHGGVQALGYPSTPYPETTGLALAALCGVHAPSVSSGLVLAQRFLKECRSADAWNWLRLGLLRQGQLPAGAAPAATLTYRTIPETALNLLVSAAVQGQPGFWE